MNISCFPSPHNFRILYITFSSHFPPIPYEFNPIFFSLKSQMVTTESLDQSQKSSNSISNHNCGTKSKREKNSDCEIKFVNRYHSNSTVPTTISNLETFWNFRWSMNNRYKTMCRVYKWLSRACIDCAILYRPYRFPVTNPFEVRELALVGHLWHFALISP